MFPSSACANEEVENANAANNSIEVTKTDVRNYASLANSTLAPPGCRLNGTHLPYVTAPVLKVDCLDGVF